MIRFLKWKENHIKACGSVSQAVALARQANKNMFIEVEVETLDELEEAIDACPDRIMLDNFSQDMLEAAVKMNQPKRCTLEVSGGITLENMMTITRLGIDFISVGAMTKSIQAIDLSLLIRKIL
jgi:nicotinate-nucleotide pyrophosphorylase (carboxylating)